MKNKGIIRRMDELGRIVIPREFRKVNLINEGDPMSISLLESGELVISKVDFTGELKNFGSKACEILSAELGRGILLAFGDEIKDGKGMGAKSLIGQKPQKEFFREIESRKNYLGTLEDEQSTLVFAVPITNSDKVFGALAMLCEQEISAFEQRILSISAKIIGSLIQNY